MGLVIEADENVQQVSVEIRRESIILTAYLEGEIVLFPYDSSAEISKKYMARLIDFFKDHPEHLVER